MGCRWLLLLVLATGCTANDPAPVPADQVCDAIRAELPGALEGAGTPGALLAFEQPGQPLCLIAAGDSDPVNHVPASTTQLYHIGSSTKTFIAATILLLDKDGVFAGKESLDAWLPGIVQNSN